MLPWLISLTSILMLWLMGNGSRWGPRLGLLTSFLWIVHAWNLKDYGLLPGIVIVGIVHARNIAKWRSNGRL